MKIQKFRIPDSSMHEDDQIFSAIGYERPRGTSYAEAWQNIQRQAGDDPAFARLVRAAIRKFVPKTRRKSTGWDSTERSLNKITSEDLAVFKRQFGKNCSVNARRGRRRYTREFGKPIEEFTVTDLRHLAKPNRFASRYFGAVWNLLTAKEKLKVELTNDFYFVAGGDIVAADVFYSAKLSKLLKRKIHPPKKEEGENVEIHRPT
jgi:hypothetical protein